MKLYHCYNLTLFFSASVTLVARYDASRNASPYYSEIQTTGYPPRGAREGGGNSYAKGAVILVVSLRVKFRISFRVAH